MCGCCRVLCWLSCLCGCFGSCMHSYSPWFQSRSGNLRGSSPQFIKLELSCDNDGDDDNTCAYTEHDTDVDGRELDDLVADARAPTLTAADVDATSSAIVAPTPLPIAVAGASTAGDGSRGGWISVLSDAQKLELVKLNKADSKAGICLYCHEAPDASQCTDSTVPRAIPWSDWALADGQVFGSLCDCDPRLIPRHLACYQREIELMTPTDSRSCKLCGGHKYAFAYRDPADEPGNSAAFPVRLMVFQTSVSSAVAALWGLEKQYALIADPPDFDAELAASWTTAWHGFRAGLFSVYCAPPGIRWICQNPPPDVYACVHAVVVLYGVVVNQDVVMRPEFALTEKFKKRLQSPKNAAWKELRAPGLDGMSFLPWNDVVRLRQRLIDLTYPPK